MEEFFEMDEEEAYWEIYRKLLDMLDKDEDEKKIVELSNEFFDSFQAYMSCLKTPQYIDLLRCALLMSHKIFNRCYLSAMYCLRGESGEVLKRYEQAVFRGLEKACNPSLNILKEYAAAGALHVTLELEGLLLLAETIVCISKVQRILLVSDEDEGQVIAYYTSLPTFCHMLPGVNGDNKDCGKMSIMNIAYMNDPNEGKILQKYLGIPMRQMKSGRGAPERKDAAYPYVFMKCFTSLVDDLPMWEMYGDHAKGCCLILDKACFSTTAGRHPIPLYRICYIKKHGSSVNINKEDNPYVRDMDQLRRLLKVIKQDMRTAETDDILTLQLKKSLEDIAYLFKNADYRHEQEVRILYRFNGPDDAFRHTPGEYPLLYVQPEFTAAIKEIIMGPKAENLATRMPYLREQIEKMCLKTKRKAPMLTNSSIEYR